MVREEFDTERSIMVDQHNIEMNDIADILFAMEQNFQDRENEAKSEFQSMTDEIRNKVRSILSRLTHCVWYFRFAMIFIFQTNNQISSDDAYI